MIRSTQKSRTQKSLFYHEAALTWGLSLLVGIGVLVFIFLIEKAIELFSPGSSSNLDSIKALWSFLTGPEPWTAMGFLLALFVLPVTLFLTVIVANRPGATEITQLAQESTCDVLYSVSRVVAILSWLFLPALLHGFTIIIAIPLVPGISFVCSFFSEFCVSEKILLRTQRQNHHELERLTALEKKLREQAARSLGLPEQSDTSELTSKGRCRTLSVMSNLVVVVVLTVFIWACVGIICFPAASIQSVALDALVVIGFILIDMVLSYWVIRTRTLDTSNHGLEILTGCFNIALLIFIAYGFALVGSHWRTWWVAIGVAALPMISCGVCLHYSQRWFVCHYWNICVKAKERCQANSDDSDQRLALQRLSHEPTPAADQGTQDTDHVTIPPEVLEKAGLKSGDALEFEALSDGWIAVSPQGRQKKQDSLWKLSRRLFRIYRNSRTHTR